MNQGSSSPDGARFFTTRWSQVQQAGHGSGLGQVALEELCRQYWPPLYAFVRRQGSTIHDAQDLVQGFFEDLLRRQSLRDANPDLGRFRTFLLAAFKNYHAKQREHQTAQKRGGNQVIISIDEELGERGLRLDPASHETPEAVYERQWSLTLLDRVLAGLATEFSSKPELFDCLKGRLSGSSASPTYAKIGARLDMTEAAVKVTAHRLRLRYRERLREEIAQTVSDPTEVDDEIRNLMDSLSS